MPNPLSRVKPNARVYIGIPDTPEYAQISHLAMRTISAWSHIDTIHATMLSGFLKADYAVAFAMYQALVGAEAKKAALIGAVRSVSPEDSILLEAVMSVCAPSRKHRNALAHHVWANANEDVPGALILIDPAVIVEQHAELYQFFADGKFQPRSEKVDGANLVKIPQLPSHDRSRMMVHTAKQLADETKTAENCWGAFTKLHQATARQPNAEARAMLLSEPGIVSAIQRLSQSR